MSDPDTCAICEHHETRGGPVVLVDCDVCGGVAWAVVEEWEDAAQSDRVSNIV